MYEIYSYFLYNEEDDQDVKRKRYGYMSWFLDSFPEKEFSKEDLIMYNILNYARKIRAPIKEKFIDIYLDSELKALIAKKNIKITKTEDLLYDDASQLQQAVSVIKEVVKEEFYKLQDSRTNIADFVIDMSQWMSKMLERRLIQTYQQGFQKINAITEKQIGVDDALSFSVKEISTINTIYNKDKLKALATSSEKKFRKVFEFSIPSINADMHGLYTTELLTIAAGGGVGKTTLALGDAIYEAAVVWKQNVAFFGLEQSEEQYRAALIARHVLAIEKKILDKDMIAKELYKKDEYPQEYQWIKIAEYDLFESGSYGKIYIRDNTNTLYLENMFNIFDTCDDLYGPFDLIAVDHMAIIKQDPNAYGKRLSIGEIVSEAYISFKQYLGNRKKAGIAVNQLNRKGAVDAANGKEIEQDSYAGGMETIRSSDYVIVISATEQMEANDQRQIEATKTRNSKGFGRIVLGTRMMCSYFFEEVRSRVLSK